MAEFIRTAYFAAQFDKLGRNGRYPGSPIFITAAMDPEYLANTGNCMALLEFLD
jgi:hypothetical protein